MIVDVWKFLSAYWLQITHEILGEVSNTALRLPVNLGQNLREIKKWHCENEAERDIDTELQLQIKHKIRKQCINKKLEVAVVSNGDVMMETIWVDTDMLNRDQWVENRISVQDATKLKSLDWGC